ncbi:Attractin [Plakobranchus ocellatus]|uniref:Attractin n=1 Tax=Plakobranchus ocellatus TaxID=259542 RepID=A0AAV4D9N1_9GAST|nr:Attractin [Plakobranchus ocellatus]
MAEQLMGLDLNLDLDLRSRNHPRKNKNGSSFSTFSGIRYLSLFRTFYKLCILSFLILATTEVSSSKSKSQACSDCDQGKCINGSCVCLPGWRGSLCDQCYGRIRVQPGKSGIIHDGAVNYTKDLACSWLLDAGESKQRILLEFHSFATECSWDHLYIHNGDSAFAPLVAAFSGIVGDTAAKPRLKFQLTGRYVFIHFYSDAAYTLPGFNISYTFDDCNLQCSDKAVCNNSICQCEPGWSGENCDVLDKGCLFNCSQHGECLQGKCHCDSGYRGLYCDVTEGDLFVENVKVQGSLSPTGQASASLVYDESDSLWLFGGYKMGNEEVGKDIFRFVLANETWLKVYEAANESSPWPRYGHSTVFYKDKFYLFGGVCEGKIKADLWSFDLALHEWTQLMQAPRDLVGHTAHVVKDMMVVIFGYSSKYGYSSRVLEYSFDSGEWSVVKTTGALIFGGYGHSSTHDILRGKIYVYGGFYSLSTTSYNLTDRLYQYDPNTKEWFFLSYSGSARYLHSAAMINGLMLTFGGSTYSDAQRGGQTKCFTSDFMIYDRDCNTWHNLPRVTEENVAILDRVGQSMVSLNNEIYMFGGFSSIGKTDLYKILPGSCSYFKTEESCSKASSGVKCIWVTDHCEVLQQGFKNCVEKDNSATCSGYNTCQSCLNNLQSSCNWCGNQCVSPQANLENCTKDVSSCRNAVAQNCGIFQNCLSCQENNECLWTGTMCEERQSKRCSEHKTCTECRKNENCGWCQDEGATKTGRCIDAMEDKPSALSSSCQIERWFYKQCPQTENRAEAEKTICSKKSCNSQTSCVNCTKARCMWCSSWNQCIDNNSYVAYFHYGQCMDWTTISNTCKESDCSHHKTCSECQAVPKCGWCNDKTNTGTGTCYDGSMQGPIVRVGRNSVVDSSVCPAERWFFNDCPKCQCHGHSTCKNDTSVCKSCEPPTTGSQCQFCSNGFYGVPKYGANCKACFCNNQADTCDHVTGACYCRTRGVIGMNCDSCDDKNKYTGNPKNGGTCYYRLTTDFQYTFNLSKPEDQNYTTINFLNTPSSSDRDVDFTLNCSSTAFINITYTSKSFPEESGFISGHLCDYFRTKFEHKKHTFGGRGNTTFMVYVYDFKTPFLLQISFVQQEKINLYKFFIIFFSCFLALILLVAAAWKIKHKVESYRRGRRLEVEMQQMARRPFSTIAVEIEKKSNPVVVDRRDHIDSVLRRRKKIGSKPSSIALEPLKDNKAAILTLLIQLPTGNSDYAPSGISGLAVGSALVAIGSNRKQSLDHIKGDRPKMRKNLTYTHPDVCA